MRIKKLVVLSLALGVVLSGCGNTVQSEEIKVEEAEVVTESSISAESEEQNEED